MNIKYFSKIECFWIMIESKPLAESLPQIGNASGKK